MIKLYKPQLNDLWFREKMMNDCETMSYNNAWGGTIPFPKERWEGWYNEWLANDEKKNFYRYLIDDTNSYVGEIAYHNDVERTIHVADVIVYAEYRKNGYGTQGLSLLCNAAKENGIAELFDDIAIDNPAINLFKKCGFSEDYRTNEYIMLKKDL